MKREKTKMTKASGKKPTVKPEGPVFAKMMHQVRQIPKEGATPAKGAKRDNVFSKSRDTREDRGSRQMKNSRSSQTFPHVR